MTETLLDQNDSQHPGVISLKEEITSVTEYEVDPVFDLLMSDVGYSPPELESTLQDKLQEISMLNDEVTLEDSLTTPLSGIEANDVCSLYKQFMEYEHTSDEALSYPDSYIMSPSDSPEEQGDDVVLGRLMSVQEKLSREVGCDIESGANGACNDNTYNDNLVMNIQIEDKLLSTANGIHPKTNLLRMADNPKFAKFKKKRLTNEPPPRIASSLPNTPRCTSPSDMVSSEERKHMEIKLIEALALPVPKSVPKQNGKQIKDVQNFNRKNNKDISKKPPGACHTKRKFPPVEPIASRCLPFVSKRFKNNLEQGKNIKDPRLKDQGGNVDPRLNKADYGTKSNVTQLKNTNLNELNSSTNTATETVDDVCIIDMAIEHDREDVGTINMTINQEKEDVDVTHVSSNHEIDNVGVTEVIPFLEKTEVIPFLEKYAGINTDLGNDVSFNIENLSKTNILKTNETSSDVEKDGTEKVTDKTAGGDTCLKVDAVDSTLEIVSSDSICGTIGINGDVTHVAVDNGSSSCRPIPNERVTLDSTENYVVSSKTIVANSGMCSSVISGEDITTDNNSELKIVEFPSLEAVEIKSEDCETGCLETRKDTCTLTTNDTGANKIEKIYSNCLIKPKKSYRKGCRKTPTTLNGTFSSASEDEYDDDDRAYNRKKSKVSKNLKTHCNSRIKTEKSLSHTDSKTSSTNSTKHSKHSRSPSRIRSSVHRKKRSRSPASPNKRSERHYSNDRYESEEESYFSYSDRSDRSDCENMDISNKLIELSNPVPYDIEHERKLRFLSGGASKGLGERRNIYAGGITEETTKAELADRFRRFGKISKITLHFRDKGDNYAFIVFEEPDNAMRAIEEGNDDPKYPHLDLCFGGRRRFVGGSYVDFDGNNRYLEESDKSTVNNRTEAGEDDFDRLLQLALNKSKNKREKSPEWT